MTSHWIVKKTSKALIHSFLCFNLKLSHHVQLVIDIFLAILVRLVFILEALFCTYYLSIVVDSRFEYFSIIGVFIIIVDGFYIIILRHGKEYTWFSISCLTYSMLMINTIWQLVFIKYDMKNHDCPASSNSTIDPPGFNVRFCDELNQ